MSSCFYLEHNLRKGIYWINCGNTSDCSNPNRYNLQITEKRFELNDLIPEDILEPEISMASQKMHFIDEQYVKSKISAAHHKTFIAEIKKTIRTESACFMIITSK